MGGGFGLEGLSWACSRPCGAARCRISRHIEHHPSTIDRRGVGLELGGATPGYLGERGSSRAKLARIVVIARSKSYSFLLTPGVSRTALR